MTVTYADTAPGADAETRRLLACEVHDRIGSGLALALRRLDLLEHALPQAPTAGRQRLDEVRVALADTLGETRELVRALRGAVPAPKPGPAPSLEAALRGCLRSMAPVGAKVRLRVRGGEQPLPHRVADEVFVIVREALRNALAHADARQVTVTVAIAPREVNACVRDDGGGFDPTAVRAAGRANGLLAMGERAAAHGGDVTIGSAPGQGTRIAVRIPIDQGEKHYD